MCSAVARLSCQYRLLVDSCLAITGFLLAANTGFFGAGIASLPCKGKWCEIYFCFLYIIDITHFGRQSLFPLHVMMVSPQCIHSKLVVTHRDFH